MVTQKMSDVITNIEQLENDVDILSSRKVLLNGISPENILNNGKMYLMDPSKYRFFESTAINRLKNINMYQLHVLLTEIMAKELKVSQYSDEEIEFLKDLMK